MQRPVPQLANLHLAVRTTATGGREEREGKGEGRGGREEREGMRGEGREGRGREEREGRGRGEGGEREGRERDVRSSTMHDSNTWLSCLPTHKSCISTHLIPLNTHFIVVL